MSSRRARNLTDYYRAGLRHKLLLVTPALVLAIAAGAALAKLPNLYKSTAIISVANPKPGESDLSSRISEFRQQGTSREALEPVLVKYAPRDESLEPSTSKMRERIKIDSEPQSGGFAVSYCAVNPETARQVTDDLANQPIQNSSRCANMLQTSLHTCATLKPKTLGYLSKQTTPRSHLLNRYEARSLLPSWRALNR